MHPLFSFQHSKLMSSDVMNDLNETLQDFDIFLHSLGDNVIVPWKIIVNSRLPEPIQTYSL